MTPRLRWLRAVRDIPSCPIPGETVLGRVLREDEDRRRRVVASLAIATEEARIRREGGVAP